MIDRTAPFAQGTRWPERLNPTLGEQFARLRTQKGRYDFRANKYQPSGGNVSYFICNVDATHQWQVGNTIAAPTADAALAGAPTAQFTNGQYLGSNKAASFSSFIQDGTGASIYEIWVPTSVSGTLFALTNRSLSGGAGDNGINISPIDAGLAVSCVANGVLQFSGSGGTLVAGTGTCVQLHTAATTWEARQGSTQLGAGSYTPPGAPQRALAKNITGQVWQARWWGSLGFTALTTSERSLVAAYIMQQTGLVIS